MNASARQIISAAIRAARQIDPMAAQDFDDALANLGGRPRKAEDESLLWTQARTARALGFSRWTIRNLTRDGRLHPVTLRGAKRYRKKEVMALAGEVCT